jgi:hypothetical protein
LDKYTLAFYGESDSDVETGIYLYDFTDKSLKTIIKTGDKLGGKTVSKLGFGREGLSGVVIGFHATFTDGTQGIYQAGELVPWGSGGEILGSSQSAPIGCTLCTENMNPLDPYLFSVALGDSGLGIDEPLWIDPDYAIGYDYAVEGANFASITPPVDIDPDNMFDLFLFDSGLGDFVDSGFDLAGGVTFSFSDNGINDVNKFSVRGISVSANLNTDDPSFPHMFPVGLTFTDPNRMVEITVIPVVGSGDLDIDIKPGSWSNCINPKSKGVITVCILTTVNFDATTVDPMSVEFGTDGAKEALGKGHIEDIDGDGDLDLVLHFRTQNTGIACGDTSAFLTGQTFDGQLIEGSDFINTIKCK